MTNEEAIKYGKEWYAAIESRGDTAQSDALTFLAWAILAMQERKKGKWIKRLIATVPFTIYGYECPFCEFRTATNNFNFCPNCGEWVEADKEETDEQ